MAEIVAVCISEEKGTAKEDVRERTAIGGHGLEGDAHAGPWHRQVSLLAEESRDVMKEKGVDVALGAYGENLITRGIALKDLPVGTKLKIAEKVLLKVTQIGKECHDRCAIYHQVGDCIMPKEGIFGRVLKGGKIYRGDMVRIISDL